jgi:hypothetical protein
MESKNKIELEKLIRAEDIVKYVRTQRIKWWGYLKRMEKAKTVGEDYGIASHRNEIQRTSKNRRGDVLKDLKKLNVKNWTYLVKDR